MLRKMVFAMEGFGGRGVLASWLGTWEGVCFAVDGSCMPPGVGGATECLVTGGLGAGVALFGC